MIRRIYFLAVLALPLSVINAQTKGKTLKKVATLQMALTEDDDMPGTRGASVVWHPVQKKYYAAMAGNIGYPLSVFNATGKRLSADDHITEADVRGLWYNPVTKTIQGNAYNENGWFEYKLNTSGMIQTVEELQAGQHQPDVQSVGAYYPGKKQVIFLKGGQVYFYDASTAEVIDSIAIHWGRKKADGPADSEDISRSSPDHNYTTVVFTGIAGSEIGFLNITSKNIELYNIKNGYLSQALKLPETAPTEPSFNFSYTNGTYWLFDMDAREWYGFK